MTSQIINPVRDRTFTYGFQIWTGTIHVWMMSPGGTIRSEAYANDGWGMEFAKKWVQCEVEEIRAAEKELGTPSVSIIEKIDCPRSTT